MPGVHLLVRSVISSSNLHRCLTIHRTPVLARRCLMSREGQDAAVSPMEEKTGFVRITSSINPFNVGSMSSSASGKTGKVGHESWVRMYLPPDLPIGSTSFQCVFCNNKLSLKNISRVKQHLLNQKVCKFLQSDQAATSTEPEIVMARASGVGTSAPADQMEAAASRSELQPMQPTALFQGTPATEPLATSADRQGAGRKRAKPAQVQAVLVPRPQRPRTTDHLRVGIIGAGENTRLQHIPRLKSIEGVEIVAVANRSAASAQAVCNRFDIPKWTGNWRDILEDESIDAVVVGTWPYMHKTLVLAALAAGKHVLTEARLAMDAREAKEMYQASLEHPHLVTQVVPSPKTLSLDHAITNLLADDAVGDILYIEVTDISGNMLEDNVGGAAWRQDVQYSGMNIMSLGILYEPLLRWLGPARRVTAMGKTCAPKLRKNPETGTARVVQVPDHLDVVAEMAVGAQAHIVISRVMGSLQPKEMYSIYGSKGTLHVNVANQSLFLVHNVRGGEKREVPINVLPVQGAGWRVEEEFIGAIRGTEKVKRSDFYTGVQYMEFTEAVFRSCQTGKAVSLPLLD